jgi:hypothetical protein
MSSQDKKISLESRGLQVKKANCGYRICDFCNPHLIHVITQYKSNSEITFEM